MKSCRLRLEAMSRGCPRYMWPDYIHGWRCEAESEVYASIGHSAIMSWLNRGLLHWNEILYAGKQFFEGAADAKHRATQL